MFGLFFLGMSARGLEGSVSLLIGVFGCLNRLECSPGTTCVSI